MKIDFGNRGWMPIGNVASEAELLNVAQQIGQPIKGANGKFIAELTPKEVLDANPLTLSESFGTDRFPLHTDTAFWSIPAKYLLMRLVGDYRRTTLILPFSAVVRRLGNRFAASSECSVWTVKTPASINYCSFRFRSRSTVGRRYDSQCMNPVNDAAKETDYRMREIIWTEDCERVRWSECNTILVSNWESLHGRGAAPDSEGQRLIQRVYIGS
jgi:hypothetical protein